jgi:hypothetical protein
MDNKVKISCKIKSTDQTCPMGLEIWVDGIQVLDQSHVQDMIFFDHYIDDSEVEHDWQFVLKNKPSDYTKIDSDNNIIKDSVLEISDVAFEDILLGHLFIKNTVYRHNFNGHGQQVSEQFFGTMGCNGTVSLKFTTPMYLWLLENL